MEMLRLMDLTLRLIDLLLKVIPCHPVMENQAFFQLKELMLQPTLQVQQELILELMQMDLV
ncbi:MAG TPA: hypothetical protein DCX68_15510, partial [Marinobacter hydrocarbonoclasticus]|nr:hypothetical protein [Marinobacter nauticus]